MEIRVHPHVKGDHRVEYEAHWYTLALPLYLGIAKSFYPTETATVEVDERWDLQIVLIVRVLFFTMRVVIKGPLFPADDDDDAR